jgi:cytochrome c-type biogenesis protein CcmE
MDPSRKRTIRLVVALTAAVLLAGALVYTSFSGATDTRQPSQVKEGSRTKVTGKVVPGSIRREGGTLLFRVKDRGGPASVPVKYTGVVPDPFQDGREVILTGTLRDGTFVGEKDSLVTKCPSKFKNKKNGQTI